MDLQELLSKYADLAVNAGINLKQNEGLIVGTSQYGLPLAREVAKQAYAAGAKHVEIMFNDDEITLSRYRFGRDYIFDQYPKCKVDALIAMYEDNYQHLFITSPNPELLREIPADRVAQDQKTASVATAPAMKYRMTAKTRWTIVAVPSPAWARSVFPELAEDKAIESLWQYIFDATRVNAENPIDAWKKHDGNLKQYVHYLNEKQFRSFILRAQGTDLEVGLADGHNWVGGSKKSMAGIPYLANIPTEEVFTTPHRLRVNGTLRATKPLSLNGKLVEDFGFTFKDGKVTDYYAAKGKDALDHLLSNDEGASYLGEIALVPDDSPISNTKILFNNTLFDENASVHFAFGQSYAYAMKDGADRDKEDLESSGANFSLIHNDFMVGGPELSITAVSADGSETVLFRDGNFTDFLTFGL
ncbi:MAG: aminopeptidase [Saccharofermentanales bacterium]